MLIEQQWIDHPHDCLLGIFLKYKSDHVIPLFKNLWHPPPHLLMVNISGSKVLIENAHLRAVPLMQGPGNCPKGPKGSDPLANLVEMTSNHDWRNTGL